MKTVFFTWISILLIAPGIETVAAAIHNEKPSSEQIPAKAKDEKGGGCGDPAFGYEFYKKECSDCFSNKGTSYLFMEYMDSLIIYSYLQNTCYCNHNNYFKVYRNGVQVLGVSLYYASRLSYAIRTPGYYEVSIMWEGASKGASHFYVVEDKNAVAVNESPGNPGTFNLYPNPSYGNMTLDLAVPPSSGISWTLLDLSGRETGVTFSEQNTLLKKQDIDLSGLLPGIYFLRLEINKQIFMKKIIRL